MLLFFEYNTVYFCIHQLMDMWVVSTFWLLCIMLLGTFLYRVLCKRVFSLVLVVFLGVELLGHVVTLC